MFAERDGMHQKSGTLCVSVTNNRAILSEINIYAHARIVMSAK